VPGLPSLLWIGADGEERRSQRITGEVDAKGFLERWSSTRDAN
jgi:thiol:disulfide interchange protein DsbD